MQRIFRALSRRLPQDSSVRESWIRVKERLRGVPEKDRLRRARNRRLIRLRPDGPEQGRVLLSFLTEPFEGPSGAPIAHHHSNLWECRCMAETFLELGYGVDVIRWTNRRFLPRHPYRICIDILHNLERLAPHLPSDCVKVLHADSAHWLFHTTAQHERLSRLLERRGVALRPRKEVAFNRGIETADCATVLGNRFTMDTYRYAGKPLLRVPVSSPLTFPWRDGKDFRESRRRFLWFGSTGFVHKGLDLVLEAFAALPDFHLTVCGPIDREPDFVEAFHRELYETENIRTLGWMDLASSEFRELAARTGAVVFPSCSEGGGSAVLSCMHAGLLPVVTRETSVDTEDFGELIEEASVEGVKEAVTRVAATNPDELLERCRRGWEHVREHHTRERFRLRYREVAKDLLQRPEEPQPVPCPQPAKRDAGPPVSGLRSLRGT